MISSNCIYCWRGLRGRDSHLHNHHQIFSASKIFILNSRVCLGFNIKTQHSNLSVSVRFHSTLPPKNAAFFNRKNKNNKKKYGGVLPSILRSLEESDDNDIEKTLHSFSQNLNPKEQTLILKEQRSWRRLIRVFEYFKSQEEYQPNVIHYNIVLRALGRAQRWDELRLRWIEMAKNGIFPTNNTYGMLVDVYGKAGFVKEAILWIKHMRIRGMFPDEVTMNTIVRVLKDAQEFDRADKFYKDWCAGQVEVDDLDLDAMVDYDDWDDTSPISFKHFLSTELFKTGGRNPVQKNMDSAVSEDIIRKPRLTSTYNTLIDLYGKAGRLEDAANVFAEMLRSGMAMDTITFNTMIFTCGSHGHLSEAESLLGKMEERGISPDTKTYNIFLSLYADVGNIDAALWCYRRIREVELYPDVVTHRALLHKLCDRNMVQEVEAVIKEMEKSNVCVDEHSVPAVMKMYINKGLLSQAKAFYEKQDVPFSSKICSAIIDAYAERGLWAEAEAVFHGKRDSAEKKNVVEYNVMVKAYGKAKLYDKAFSLFREMRNCGTWPDECTYNSLIQMFSWGNLVDRARKLLIEMQQSGFKPQCLTFSAVIACYARLGQLSDAVDVFKEMEKAGVEPNEVVYGSLINGFAETGKTEEAFQYYRMMGERGIPENQKVLTSLSKAYSKVGCIDESKLLYETMKKMEGGTDVIASNSMIGLFADHGMLSEAKAIFDNLKEKGQADGVSFAAMMYLYKNLGMLYEAINVAKEMKGSGLLADCTSYNKVMACYLMNGQLQECGALLHDMLCQKFFPETGTFRVLFTVLKKGGLPTEAIGQLESAYSEGKPYARQAVVTSVYAAVGLTAFALGSCAALMTAEGPFEPFVYNVTIYACGLSRKFDNALSMYMRMKDDGLMPDIVTNIFLVSCYGKAGMVEGVKRIHMQLKYGQIQPNESLFKAVIDAYINCYRHELAELELAKI